MLAQGDNGCDYSRHFVHFQLAFLIVYTLHDLLGILIHLNHFLVVRAHEDSEVAIDAILAGYVLISCFAHLDLTVHKVLLALCSANHLVVPVALAVGPGTLLLFIIFLTFADMAKPFTTLATSALSIMIAAATASGLRLLRSLIGYT